MARLRCHFCFKRLVYVKGKPVFVLVDIGGTLHKAHKGCARQEREEHGRELRKLANQREHEISLKND